MLPGCALIDAASGSSDECTDAFGSSVPCNFATCDSPYVIPFVNSPTFLNVCPSFGPPITSAACSPNPEAYVMQFLVPYPGEFSFCVSSNASGTLTVSDACNSFDPVSFGQCISSGCVSIFLDPVSLQQPGSVFLLWSNDRPGICSQLDVMITDVPTMGSPESGGLCIDGLDNNADGLTDCEEIACQNEGVFCNVGLGVESCDARDDGPMPGFPMDIAFTDESGCACQASEGCDALGSGPEPYICHRQFATGFGVGVCNPDCNRFPWCEAAGGQCTPTGECIN